MDAKARARATSSTQEHLQVKDIVEDLVITATGSAALVIQTTAVNFDLLSEYEQDNKIYAFAGLLNSLNFPIQILIKTNRVDISTYVNYLKAQRDNPMTPGLKNQLEIYTQFIQNLIVQNDVLDKKFYLVIPYNPVVTLNPSGILKLNKDKENIDIESNKLAEKGKIFLHPKRDHVLKQLARMGLMGHQLTNAELLELFYNLYNPEKDGK
ncbi:hypothetical protein M0R04_02270 [Candidatus Dojkabacteria bacterium]|jgi:hypothetical protein|nr:hypothetical protein [Candidatus Dojkabacteria bacterium]